MSILNKAFPLHRRRYNRPAPDFASIHQGRIYEVADVEWLWLELHGSYRVSETTKIGFVYVFDDYETFPGRGDIIAVEALSIRATVWSAPITVLIAHTSIADESWQALSRGAIGILKALDTLFKL